MLECYLIKETDTDNLPQQTKHKVWLSFRQIVGVYVDYVTAYGLC